MDKDNAGLEPVRHGENEIPELSSDVQMAGVMPIHPEDKLKFRDELADMLEDLEMTDLLKMKMKTFFMMHHAEMMAAVTFNNQLSNRHLVFAAFQKDFPEMDIKNHVSESHPNYSTFETVFNEFDKHNEAVLNAMTLATDHFNKSCAILMKIETMSKDPAKSEFTKVQEGALLMTELLNLHKGIDGEQKQFT